MQLRQLVKEFMDVFQEDPGVAKWIIHHIATSPGKMVKEAWRCIPQNLHELVRAEIGSMLEKGVSPEIFQ